MTENAIVSRSATQIICLHFAMVSRWNLSVTCRVTCMSQPEGSRAGTQIFQNPLIKEYILSYSGIQSMLYGIFLNYGTLEGLGIWASPPSQSPSLHSTTTPTLIKPKTACPQGHGQPRVSSSFQKPPSWQSGMEHHVTSVRCLHLSQPRLNPKPLKLQPNPEKNLE